MPLKRWSQSRGDGGVVELGFEPMGATRGSLDEGLAGFMRQWLGCSLQLPQHQHFCWGLTQARLTPSACGFHAHLKTYRPTLVTALCS